MVTAQVPGVVIGTPGGSLVGAGATWAKNQQVAQIGQKGEVLTGRILNRLALQPGGPTVLHDLRIPIPGFSANIDHAVVSGSQVTLLDSKVWKPGFYWTLGATRRGLETFTPGDKKTLPTGVEAFRRHLDKLPGVHATFGRSVMVVWPSTESMSLTLWAFRPQSAAAVTGAAFTHRAARLVGHRPADPRIVAALRALVH